MVLGCICATPGVSPAGVTVEAGTQTGTLILTRLDDVPTGLTLDVVASQAQADSGAEPASIRLELQVAEGVTLVGDGDSRAGLDLLDVDRRLRECEAECRLPLTIETPEGSGTYTIRAGDGSRGNNNCTDTFLTVALEF